MKEYLGSILVFLIIGGAAFYVIRKFYLSFKNDDASTDCCGGGCGSCGDGCNDTIDEYYSEDSDK